MPELVTGKCTAMFENIFRILAPNPGVMTGPGTNTYAVGHRDWGIIDPGPLHESHVNILLDSARANDARITHIFVTHTHRDHSPAARLLQEMTGATVLGTPPPADGAQDSGFIPDIVLEDGKAYPCGDSELVAVATPGHVSNHFCFYHAGQRTLFAGDHLMNGSTVVIIPPQGDMLDYIASLRKLHALPLHSILPAHGDIMGDPHAVIDHVIAHRLLREQKVVTALTRQRVATANALVAEVYSDTPQYLWGLAEQSLKAHLIKLVREERVAREDDLWRWIG